MAWAPDEETQQLIWHLALQNAFEYEGKGAVGSVIGRIMSMRADLRQFGGQLSPIVAQSVQKQTLLLKKKDLSISNPSLNLKPHTCSKADRSRRSEKDS